MPEKFVAVAAAVLLGLGIATRSEAVLVLVGVLVAAICFANPRLAVGGLLVTLLLFSEETWQYAFIEGTSIGAATFYTANVSGVTIQLLLVGAALVRTVLHLATAKSIRPRPIDWILVGLVGLTVFAEVWGRVQSGYSAMWIGHAQFFVLPVLSALLIRVWFSPSDLSRLLTLLFAVASARCAFGLVRYAFGGGDFHFEFARRIVFWDAADGLIAAGVVAGGIALAVASGHRRGVRALGAACVVTGLLVAMLSLRRAGMLAVLIAGLTAVWTMTTTPGRKAAALAVALTVVGGALGVGAALASDAIVVGRLLSVARTSGPLAATNMWHLADLADGLHAIAMRPLLGWGYHVAPPRTVAYLQSQVASIESIGLYHNMYIYAWVRMGFFGAAGVVASALAGLRAARELVSRGAYSVTSAGLAGVIGSILVAGMTAHTLWSFRIPYMFFGAIAASTLLAEATADRGAQAVHE